MHTGRAVFQFSFNSLAAERKSLTLFISALLLTLLLVPLSGGLSKAIAADWLITRLSGTVYLVAPGIEAHRARKGMALHKGYTIATRKGARVVLQRDNGSITVGPNTEFALSQYQSNDTQTTLLQRKGTIEVDVAKRGRPFFKVETPYLAAVVKGTRFSVSVRNKESQVSVRRGVVGVQDLASGQRSDVQSGQSVRSAPDKYAGLKSVGKTPAAIQQGTPGKPTFGKVQSPPSPVGKNTRQSIFGGRSNLSNNHSYGGSSGNGGNYGSGGNSNGNAAGNHGSGSGNSSGNSSDNSGSSGSSHGGSASAGASSAGASAGASSAGASAGASAGGASAGASAGNGGASANASAGGISAGASVSAGGASANVGGGSVSTGR
ncbi:hypothetical protein SIAM614_11518 [Stappia aggregata IAM 12614]|uniref:FecR protein domain-containing protein n=1 Tax=Roseibium aggregatum (strain ATCC 25650 / DSM 13394 / JCM 20685 / NBRC 16684 / NCIMB 2208 / IAM 12614 / B1) TaxID=384765 RepID=A0NTJ1_ROSAI|nr:FecR family protein [Roseibium aggregatum]EAV43750.1 hypothetical protein SIAM614_11518 [Stappia aggregata IAM 12614] [Roseibium aggregatum IAM 12614]